MSSISPETLRQISISLPCLGEEEWQALREPIESGWITQGKAVGRFEKAFAERHQVKHALATTSCTTALHVILVAMGIGPGDEVIVPAFTWIATANVVQYVGATPIFVDVDPLTYNLDVKEVARRVTPRTKAIIAVHLFGLCADMDSLQAAAPGIPIVEDAACASGSSYQNRSAGSLGIAAAFSFHPRKTITTGEGGMVTTNDENLAESINRLRNHGASISEEQRHLGARPYLLPEFNLLGFNYRMTDLQGAIGEVQLGKLDRFLEERRIWASYYSAELAEIPWLRTPCAPAGYEHGWQAYVCRVDEEQAPMSRNEIMEKLLEKGINTRPGTHAVHMLGFYREQYGLTPDDFPMARDCDRLTLAIPLHNQMTAEDYAYVVAQLKSIGGR